MSVILWLVLGLIEGVVARLMAGGDGPGLAFDMVLGAAGAVAGGLIYSSFCAGPMVFSLLGMGGALVGAVIVLIFYHAVMARLSS